MTVQYVEIKIKRFRGRFNELKKATKKSLEKREISVVEIVDAITSMPSDDIEEHKQFLKENLKDLYESSDVAELFGRLSVLHWDYLSYQMLEYLVKEFGLEVGREMEVYKQDLQRFRQKTPLALFCRSQKRRRRKPSEEFKKVVAEFDWPHEVMLEVVEQFRQKYAYHYNLRECAMMLAEICPGSFIVTWFIPESIVKKLKSDVPNHILKEYSVMKLEIAGVPVFPAHVSCVVVTFLSCTSYALSNEYVLLVCWCYSMQKPSKRPAPSPPLASVDTDLEFERSLPQ